MQRSLTYRTNRDLFSNHYLDEHLPETEAWEEVDSEELEAAYEEIVDLYEREKDTAPKRNESQLEEKFIRPMFRKLGIPFEVEESTSRTQRRPDYGFFESDDAARSAFERREEGGDFYESAVAVADAKRWGRPLDTRGSGEHERDFENPSYQIHVYLQETPARWAVLTDGKKWRLYYGPTSHRLDSYYEIDLPTVLETGDLEEFKYFYLFFRHGAFLEDAGGDCFLDEVYDESNVFAQDLGEDLQDNIYEAIKVLSEGYLQYPENDLDEGDLDLIHDASLIYLYRLIFVLYAEAEGRDLLDTDNGIYEESYSLNSLKQEIAAELDSGDPKYRDWQDDLSSRLDELFELIDQGSKSRGIPEDDLHIPAYNGGLFRTDPDPDDGAEARFLAEHTVGDAHLARVVELLTRSRQGDGEGKIFVDYSSLDVRHLGSIYEGLLEYQLHVADEPLTLDDGEYAPVDEDADAEDVAVEPGEVYLTTGSGERKATGSYYTPEYVVEYIVDETLGPLVDDIREDLVGYDSYSEGGFADEFAERVFDLKILDPAMGSGHFLTSAVDYLAREIIDAQERQAAQQGVETVDEERDINWARRKVAQRCIYGVDLNPLATELAKVSLWLRTLAAEQPLAFLDHHLKTGNSLVGSDIEDVLANGDDADANDGQLTLEQSFAHTRQQALEHVMDRFQSLLAIDNETLEDAKEMEDVYDAVREDPLYQHLLAMANVHTAERFGLDVPSDADKRMAEALRADSWSDIEGQDWFTSAQAMAADERFFHWELEFPVAFYDEDGGRKADAGFDAVIGNPPYIRGRSLPEEYKSYLNKEFETAHKSYDIYVLFLELAIKNINPNGLSSMIVPRSLLSESYGEKIREKMLDETRISSISDYLGVDVFDGVSVINCIPVLRKKQGSQTENEIQIRVMQSDQEYSIRQDLFYQTPQYTYRIGLTPELQSVLSNLNQQKVTIGDVCYVSYSVAAHSEVEDKGKDEYIFEQKINEKCVPFAEGKEISRYAIDWDGRYLEYDPEILRRPSLPELFENTNIAIKGISGNSGISAAYNDDSYYLGYPAICLTLKHYLKDIGRSDISFSTENINQSKNHDLRFILSILNSKLMKLYFDIMIFSTSQTIYSTDIREIPLPDIEQNSRRETDESVKEYQDILDDYLNSNLAPREFLSDLDTDENELNQYTMLVSLSDRMNKLSSAVLDLNTDILDYLGNYENGPRLPDVGLFQPSASNVLDATTEEYEKLRVGDVRAERDGTRVTISATARYKPDDEDAHETDTYGYTETEFVEAFTLVDCSEAEAALVAAFVPVAVDDEIAGFRDNATKTNSLVDRLKAITLPDPDDVADDLDRYVETKARADELDAKIAETDRLIDEIVYDLYDLTEEEIEIVEAAVAE
ncbi:Eco57I restriction-modification methylase domain-containing protein [Halorubrum trapanicum]|uniref:Eco57I restriction-modification methylase domain-containing protein n=1 Tax=Halorubrum trapanicum TaxID=29284 RepID=UPI000BBB0C2D|nr:N-6 DNA methylase [Halorubrum trapanicum]